MESSSPSIYTSAIPQDGQSLPTHIIPSPRKVYSAASPGIALQLTEPWEACFQPKLWTQPDPEYWIQSVTLSSTPSECRRPTWNPSIKTALPFEFGLRSPRTTILSL